MPIPRRNPLAPPVEKPAEEDFKEIEVNQLWIDITFAGGIVKSFTLEDGDSVEPERSLMSIHYKNGVCVTVNLEQVLCIEEVKRTVKKKVKLDPIAELRDMTVKGPTH